MTQADETLRHGPVLHSVRRCPQCGIASPLLTRIWRDYLQVFHQTDIKAQWALYRCSSCLTLVMARGAAFQGEDPDEIVQLYPDAQTLSADLPERARAYLSQAMESLHAPDGVAMLVASSVDAMLKAQGFGDGSLYARIERGIEKGILTTGMGEWAHHVRLESNRPRHADLADPHVSQEEAENLLEFAKALAQFLFELPARIRRGKEAAGAASKG